MLVWPIWIYFLTFTLFFYYVKMFPRLDIGHVWTSCDAYLGFKEKVDLSALWSYLVKSHFRTLPVKFLGITSIVFVQCIPIREIVFVWWTHVTLKEILLFFSTSLSDCVSLWFCHSNQAVKEKQSYLDLETTKSSLHVSVYYVSTFLRHLNP